MHLRSSRVFVQTTTAPLVRSASVTTSQELNSVTAQGNCQSKTFYSPNALRKKRGGGGVDLTDVTTNTDTPRVAKSPTQLANISMGITALSTVCSVLLSTDAQSTNGWSRTQYSTDSLLHYATHYAVPQLPFPFALLHTLAVRYPQYCDSP